MKKSFLTGLVAMLVVGLILAVLAGCGSSPSSQSRESLNERAYYAVFSNNIDELKIAIQNGADVNYSEHGISLLKRASGGGNLAMVRYLVEHVADVNLRDPYDGGSALMSAAREGHTDIVRYLVEQGASVNLRTNEGATAASIAYDRGNVDIYDYLFANGAREFEPRQTAQQPASPSSTTNVYVQPSAPAQSPTPAPAPAPSAPTFQPGRYAFSGSNITMSLTGYQATAYSGYEQVAWGTYRINGNQIVITFNTGIGAGAILQGKTFAYTITSNTSFSGSGETWVRTGY
jgi:hypothetical protein